MRPVVKRSICAALLAGVGLAGAAVTSAFAVLTVQLPAAYSGWVLLVPSLQAPAGELYVFVPDANGVCLMDTALIRKTVIIRVRQRGQNVEDATVYTGLTEGTDEQHRSYKGLR